MSSYKEYKDLLSKTYDEAVRCLLQKYGFAQDDYYREKSYQRFMNGEIKIIKKIGSRTSEGLYCHHIDENKALKISDPSFIKRNKIPFEYQKKDRLVYCDLIEHAILHVLIAKETNFEFGYPGYEVYIKPNIEKWYIEKIIPDLDWEMHCLYKSFLNPEEAVNILKEMQKTLGESYYSTPSDYYEAKQKAIEELKAQQEARKKEEIQQAIRWEAREKQIIKEKTEEFYRTYPNFKKSGICFDTPRRKVIAMLYDYKYCNIYKSKKELDLAMKPFNKEELLKELHSVIEE